MRIDVPQRRRPGIRLSPLIDVVFILLVFFMLASSFLDWRAYELGLPAADATPDPEVTPIAINVRASGDLRLQGEPIEPAALVRRVRQLHEQAPDRPVVVRPDAATPVHRTVDTLDRLQAGGVSTASLAAGAS